MFSEFINLHIGEAGVQIGNACWKLYCLEHGIQPDGQMSSDKTIGDGDDSFRSFFDENEEGRHIPRAVFVDPGDAAMDKISIGSNRQLFLPNQLISKTAKTTHCHNIYSRGVYMEGSDISEQAEDAIRKQAERCSDLQGFLFTHSLGGGTGSGLTTRLIQNLTVDFGCKKTRLLFSVYNGPRLSAPIVEPYNAVMSISDTMDLSDGTFLFDNDRLYDICRRNLGIWTSNYDNVNRLIAQVVSSITAGQRFSGTNNRGLTEIQAKLMPYPRIHFPLVTYAPIFSGGKSSETNLSVSEITNAVFDSRNQMVKCNPNRGKYIASCLLFRGDVIPKDVNAAIESVQANRNLQFIEGQPTDIKVCTEYTHFIKTDELVTTEIAIHKRYPQMPRLVATNPNDVVKTITVKRPLKFRAARTTDVHIGLTRQPPAATPGGALETSHRATCKLDNTTAIGQVWARLNRKFKLMFDKRAFVHWFVFGGNFMLGHMSDAQQNLVALENDYKELDAEPQQE